MKLFSLRALPRVFIFATNDSITDDWSRALRIAGLSINSSNCLTFPMLNNHLCLLIQPDISLLLQVKQFLQRNQDAIDNLYIISDEAEWIELSQQFSFRLLSTNTHPLEVARIFNHSKKAVTRNYFARYATFFNF